MNGGTATNAKASGQGKRRRLAISSDPPEPVPELVLSYPRGVAPRTPPHALSRAASPARSVRVARSRAHSRSRQTPLSRCPSLSFLTRGASPLGLPHTRSHAPLRRRAPFAWLARALTRDLVRRPSAGARACPSSS